MCDGQAALEKTLTGLPVALAGTSLIYGAGMLEMGVTFDLAQLVMDNEIARMIRKYVAGVAISDPTLALDEIRDVGVVQGLPLHRLHLRAHARAQRLQPARPPGAHGVGGRRSPGRRRPRAQPRP